MKLYMSLLFLAIIVPPRRSYILSEYRAAKPRNPQVVTSCASSCIFYRISLVSSFCEILAVENSSRFTYIAKLVLNSL